MSKPALALASIPSGTYQKHSPEVNVGERRHVGADDVPELNILQPVLFCRFQMNQVCVCGVGLKQRPTTANPGPTSHYPLTFFGKHADRLVKERVVLSQPLKGATKHTREGGACSTEERENAA